jgi:hypothetical protein
MAEIAEIVCIAENCASEMEVATGIQMLESKGDRQRRGRGMKGRGIKISRIRILSLIPLPLIPLPFCSGRI